MTYIFITKTIGSLNVIFFNRKKEDSGKIKQVKAFLYI